jgi:eukaryotic-like serine/threonine-protein kinase
VLAAFVGVLVWFSHQIYLFLLPPANTITVPSFVGQSVADATAAAQQINLISQVVDHSTSDRYPKGVVMNQRPEAGTPVRAGRQIDFVVSDGIVSSQMPDLRYQSMREVTIDLARAKLQLGRVTRVKSDLIPADHVIEQDPQPLADVVEGQSVNLVLSSGGARVVRVPQFVGKRIDDARKLAAAEGVSLGQIVWTPLGASGPKHGMVARQSIAAGTRIESFEPVSLDVSAGPNESGYIIRQVRVLASVPVSDTAPTGKSVAVVLRVRDATGEYDAYRAYAQPGQKLDFTVTAVGSSIVDLYVDNELVGTTRLGEEPKKIYDEGKPSPKPSGKPSPSPSPGGH